jgi:hypothetical protein
VSDTAIKSPVPKPQYMGIRVPFTKERLEDILESRILKTWRGMEM